MGTAARPSWLRPATSSKDDIEAVEANLFSHAGIHLPCTVAREIDGAAPEIEISNYNRNGRNWKVYRNLSSLEDIADVPGAAEQFSLGLPAPRMKVTRVIMPQYVMFMSATIRGFCRDSRLLENAARHLMRQDVLYVGDLTRMSRRELAFRLGPYRKLTGEFEARMVALGLAFNARASWWERPADYYGRAY